MKTLGTATLLLGILFIVPLIACDDPLPDDDDETEVQQDDTPTDSTEISASPSLLDTISISQAQLYYEAGYSGEEVIARGYIVGVANGTTMSNAQFDGTFTRSSNIILADDSTETDYNYCMPVELELDSEQRSKLNLVDNPDLRGRLLAVCGTLTTYFSVAGVKDLTDWKLYDASYSIDSDNSDEQEILPDDSDDSDDDDTPLSDEADDDSNDEADDSDTQEILPDVGDSSTDDDDNSSTDGEAEPSDTVQTTTIDSVIPLSDSPTLIEGGRHIRPKAK